MRVVAMLLTVAALLAGAIDAAAQTGARPAPAPAAAPGATTNSNTVSSGSNRNTNANSNSQFLSGSNTGVNNGSLEIYTGADPYQGIVIGGSTNLPQLPGIPSPPSNFSQPYRPDAFVNTPPFLPTEMSVAEAKQCRDAKASWYGGSRDAEAPSIRLFYAGKPEIPSAALTMANYVGTVMATTADGPFLAALCEAAYRAMRKGATVGVVEFNIRPKNTMFGLGFGASGGATGLPAAGAHPYALAATLGFGTGWSNQRVEGEVVLQLTALRAPSIASTEPTSTTPSEPTTAETPAPSASPTPTASPTPSANPPVKPGPASKAGPVSSDRTKRPADDDQTAADRDAPAPMPYPAAAPAIILTAASASMELRASRTAASAGARTEALVDPAREATSSDQAPADRRSTLTYHPATRLANLRSGQSKDEVFGLFGGMFARQGETIVEIQGMRLRASGQTAAGARVEVSDVVLIDERARETSYWFLFGENRLLAWGRAEQWSAAATKHRVDLPYRPSPRPQQVEAKADPAAGR